LVTENFPERYKEEERIKKMSGGGSREDRVASLEANIRNAFNLHLRNGTEPFEATFDLRHRANEMIRRIPSYQFIVYNEEADDVAEPDFDVFGARATSPAQAATDYTWMRGKLRYANQRISDMEVEFARLFLFLTTLRDRNDRGAMYYLLWNQYRNMALMREAQENWQLLIHIFLRNNPRLGEASTRPRMFAAPAAGQIQAREEEEDGYENFF